MTRRLHWDICGINLLYQLIIIDLFSNRNYSIETRFVMLTLVLSFFLPQVNTTILGAHGNDIHRNNSTYSVIKVNNKNGKNCNFLSKEPQMTFGFAWIICRQLKKPRRPLLGSQMIRTRFKIRYSRALIVVSMSWLPYPSLCLVIIIPEEINKVIAVYFAFHNGAYLFKCLNVVKFKSWYFPLYPYFLLLLPFSTTPSPFSSPISCV